jgi:hypothetical protein
MAKNNTNVKMSKTFNLGKIAYTNPARRANLVTVTVELRQCGGEETFSADRVTGRTPRYVELSICGDVWNCRHTDIVCGGQCLDIIHEYREQLSDPDLFDELFTLWQNYHLNGMHAGTPEQERRVKEWLAAGNRYEYTAVCNMLKAEGLYEMPYTGLSVGRRFDNEPHRYGTAWLVEELPSDVLLRVEHLLSV